MQKLKNKFNYIKGFYQKKCLKFEVKLKKKKKK